MKDLNRLYALVKMEAVKAGVPVSNHILRCSVNTRLRKSMGRCIRKTDLLGVVYEIEVAGCMLADNVDEMEIRDTIMHELIHTAPHCFDHGYYFHKYAEIVNRKYGYHVDTYADTEQLEAAGVVIKESEYKYILRCSRCGHEWKYKRIGKILENPWAYNCGCGGSLSAYDINGNVLKSKTHTATIHVKL